jgi:hypothetical protein
VFSFAFDGVVALVEVVSDATPAWDAAISYRACALGDEILFWAVAQMVGFGLGKSEIPYLSTGVDWTLSPPLHCSSLYPIVQTDGATTSGATKAVGISSAMLPLVTAQTVASERGVGGRISRWKTYGAKLKPLEIEGRTLISAHIEELVRPVLKGRQAELAMPRLDRSRWRRD